MKYLPFIPLFMLFLSSCKKETNYEANDTTLLNVVMSQLKDSISPHDYQRLAFNHSVISRFDKQKISILVIPFLDKSPETDFMLLKVEKDQRFSIGRIVHLERELENRSPSSLASYNGEITIHSLKGEQLMKSIITNGFIEAFYPKDLASAGFKETVVEVPLMPEVVVVASYPPSSSWSYSTWFNFVNMIDMGKNQFGGGGEGGGVGSYSRSSPNTGSSGSPQEAETITVDFEQGQVLSEIDISRYLQCFRNIPDEGSTCSIRLLTDLPVDGQPTVFFEWEANSPGHAFLQITKVNGSQKIQQNIGFYPEASWKSIFTTAPLQGKFVDNENHEFNASITMDLNPEDFQSTLTHLQYLANFVKYDIDEYNCTDLALEVFNYKRGSNKITIPMYDIPGGTAPNGSSTPQGLYQKLVAMKAKGDASSANISVPAVKGYAGSSNGPCN